MSETAPDSADARLPRRHAFLLSQLANAREGILSQPDANKAIPKQIRDELGLGPKPANAVRDELTNSGWLAAAKIDKKVVYEITDAGKLHLRDLERYVPLAPAKGKLNLPADAWTERAREAYVLTALSQAPDRTISKADLEVGFGGKGRPKAAELSAKQPHLALFRDQHCLGLNPATTRAVLTDLALRGAVRVQRAADAESYSLTTDGADLLGRLRAECPVLPPAGKPSPAPKETLRHAREAYLLFKLFQSAKRTLWGSDAHASSKKEPLKLNHATCWQVRGELAQAGYIALNWDGKEGRYTLTPSGVRYLTTLPFDELGEMKIKGSVLTELLTAAREGERSATRGGPPPPAGSALTAEQLEAAVTDTFHDLLRGEFAGLQMVPIHELRRVVAERFGAHAASHSVFDERLLDMRRTDKVRLISIDDRSRATPDQLRDSISAVGETFFYAEKAHARG
ncbi:hypothetical protein [Gemmata sp.]|uniref:hypothetical protein n=1 Tax=Gemmata sp. TaxID=1914242 RepID=UPI003F6E5302